MFDIMKTFEIILRLLNVLSTMTLKYFWNKYRVTNMEFLLKPRVQSVRSQLLRIYRPIYRPVYRPILFMIFSFQVTWRKRKIHNRAGNVTLQNLNLEQLKWIHWSNLEMRSIDLKGSLVWRQKYADVRAEMVNDRHLLVGSTYLLTYLLTFLLHGEESS